MYGFFAMIRRLVISSIHSSLPFQLLLGRGTSTFYTFSWQNGPCNLLKSDGETTKGLIDIFEKDYGECISATNTNDGCFLQKLEINRAGRTSFFFEKYLTRIFSSESHSGRHAEGPDNENCLQYNQYRNSLETSNGALHSNAQEETIGSICSSRTDVISPDAPNALHTSEKQQNRKKLLRMARNAMKSYAKSLWHARDAVQVVKKIKETLGNVDATFLVDELLLHVSRGGADEKGVCWFSVNDGLKIIHEFKQIGLYPTRLGLEALLDGCAAQGDAMNAKGIMDRMKELRLPPTVFTLVRLFRVAVAAEDEDLGCDSLYQMPPWDAGDADVQLLIRVILKPLADASAMPGMKYAPGTLPRLRQTAEILLERASRLREEGTKRSPGTVALLSSEAWQHAEHVQELTNVKDM